jgi:unspecific monooxygenase
MALQSLMTMEVLFAALLVFLLLLIIWIGLSAYLSPLNRIPNAHPSVPFIGFWMFWNHLQDREIHSAAEAFRKKGPVVRLGPNEIAVNVIEGGIKTVHNGGFHKSQWYDCFINYGLVYQAIPSILLETLLRTTRIRNTFSSLGNDHAVLRRRVSHIYSKAYLHKSQHIQAIISNVLQACLRSINESADNGIAIDFLSLSFAHGIDCITAIIFGSSAGHNLRSRHPEA